MSAPDAARADVVLRPAEPADIDAVTAVFRRCWTESYASVLPSSLIERMDETIARALWERSLGAAEFGTALVAVDVADGPEEPAGPVLGVTRFSTTGDAGHVSSLYVSPDAQGRGVGRLLLTTAATAMAARGARTATLWVFADNTPSRAFYTRMGWAPDGETRVQEHFGEPEVRMARTLQPIA